MEVKNLVDKYSTTVFLGSAALAKPAKPSIPEKLEFDFQVNALGEQNLDIQNVSGSHLFGFWMVCNADFDLIDAAGTQISPTSNAELDESFVFDHLPPRGQQSFKGLLGSRRLSERFDEDFWF